MAKMRLTQHLYNLATDKYQSPLAVILKLVLWVLSFIYRLIVTALIGFYRLRPAKLDCKLVSIGNITVGGTGKTPLVELVAGYLVQDGHKIAVISRGYAAKNDHADEPAMLKQNLASIPVISDPNRIRASRKAINELGVDTVIFDDGFQQWKIHKDLEIVTINAQDPFGNGWLIPRGILREPLQGLLRADIFVLTNTQEVSTQKLESLLRKLNPNADIVKAALIPKGLYNISRRDVLLDTAFLGNTPVALFSGIGNPDSFEALARSMGMNVQNSWRFADHYAYTDEDILYMIRQAQENRILYLVTTQKDALRLEQLRLKDLAVNILILRVEAKIIDNEERFYHRLHSLYSA